MNSLNTLRRLWMYAFLLLFSNYLVGQTDYVPNQLLVKFKPNIANTLAANTMQSVSATVVDNFENLSIQQWEVPDVVSINSETSFSNLENLAEYLMENNPNIEFVEPNFYMSSTPTDFIPDDPFFTQLWALNNIEQTGGTLDADIDAVEAWGETTGSDDIVVGILDSGIDWKHPDLIDNIWRNMGEDADGDGQILVEIDGQWVFDPDDQNGIDDDGNGYVDDLIGWDFADEDNDPDDLNSHGTHVAGTIGAVGNNSTGIVGVSHNVRLMALRFLNSDGVGAVSDAVRALNYAISKGVHLTNNSWGSTGFSQSLRDAIEQAAEANQLFIVAAGNNATDNDVIPNYPSNFDLDNVISVIATDENDQVAGFSNYGAESADLAAPGVGIFSTLPDGMYGSANGTSMAAPHVAGAAVLLLSEHPDATYSKVKQAILESVDVLDNLSGLVNTGGRLNVHSAVLSMQECNVVADFTPPTGTICAGDLQTFGSNSTGDIVSYEWYVDGEFVTNDENAKIIFTEDGEHEVKLVTVGEGEDCVSEISKSVYVTEPADAGFTYSSGGLEVTFQANEVSEDYSYLWNFDSGNGSGTESTATHTFPVAGIYVATLQITNACGEMSFVVEDSVIVEELVLPDCPTMDDIDMGAGGVTFDICSSAEGNSVNLGSNSPVIGGDFSENAVVVWSQAADDPIQVEIGADNVVTLGQHEGCDVGVYHFFSTISCTEDEEVSLDGNTVTYMVYPTPNAPIVTQDEENACQYMITTTCDFEAVSEELIVVEPGAEAGVREVNVSNPGCVNIYPVSYEACPVEVTEGCPTESDIIPGSPEISGCSNMISLPFITIEGENAENAVVIWSLAGVPDFEIEEGQVPIITLPENNDCEAKEYLFRADIMCIADGTILPGGEHTYIYYPRPQAPTIVRADDECNYTIEKNCPNDVVVMNPEDLFQEPGTEEGILIVSVSNGCDIDYTYPVSFEACPPACPTEEEVTIVESSMPVCNSAEGNVVDLPEVSVVGEAAENAVIVWKVVSPEGAAIEIPEGATSVELPQNSECGHVLYEFEATVFCSKNESVELYGGYANYEVYPAPQAPMIEQVQDEATGTCSYTVVPNCENDTVTPAELEDAPHNTLEGVATFEVSNAGCEAAIFELVIEECPTVCVLEEEFERIEEENPICNLEEGNAVVFPELNVDSENAESMTLTWTQAENGAPMLDIVDGSVVLEQNNSCEVVTYEFYLTVGCSKDESISYDGGQVTYLLYPTAQAPTIERSNSEELEAEVCSYVVLPACEGDVLSETEFTQEDGSGENLREITVSNGGCEETFSVEYEECPALPCAWKIAENTVKCNAPVYTMCIEAVDSLTDVIGINFTLNYPEGVVLADADPSAYFKPSGDLVGDISNVSSFSNVAPDGSLNVVLFLNDITVNTFNGAGTLGCVEFHFVEEMHNAWPEATFSISSFQQSYLLETKEMCVDDGLLTIDFDPGHELSFMVRGDETRPLTDDATTPITSIYSADDTCSPSNNENALLDENGSAIVGSTDNFKFARHVGCEPLNPVVNGEDALLAAMIVARDSSYMPNTYALVAADVNENGIVDGGDISLILARSVGAICSYPVQADKDTSDWVTERYEVATEDAAWMMDPAYPYGTGEGADANNVPLTTQCHYTPEPLGDTCAYTFSNYVAILKGDIDDTWNQDYAMMAEAPGKLVIDFNEMAASIDDNYYIPVYYNGEEAINAVDLRLSINTDELDVEEVRLASNNNGLKINYAWNQYENDVLLSAYTLDSQIKAGKPVFYIVTSTHPTAISSNSVSASGAMLNGIPSGVALVGDVFTDIDHIKAETYELRAYPNPADNSLNLSFSQEYGIEQVTYTVFDFTGKQVQQHTTMNTTTEIKTSELAAGTYLITVQDSSNGALLAREKVLIVH